MLLIQMPMVYHANHVIFRNFIIYMTPKATKNKGVFRGDGTVRALGHVPLYFELKTALLE